MKNKRFKRETAWLVVGTLMVSTMLAGCGKKNVDYDIDGSNGNKDSGSLQDKYDIPQSYDGSIAVGDSGLREITVKVSDISIPDTAIMYTEKLSKNNTGQEGRKKAAEAIFDKSKGIYAYDEDNMTKADIEAQIDSWEAYKKNLGTDADHIKEANDAIAELQDKLEKAPDTYPAAGDYSALRYLGTIGDHEFIFTPPNDEDTDYEHLEHGDDFGSPHETWISNYFGVPTFVVNYPASFKAFYMKPVPGNPERVLCADLLAPEGYGEIIGGSMREDDYDALVAKMEELGMDRSEYEFYLDLRKYGSVPHGGFGIGIERMVTFVAGTKHIREAIPFPRMLHRIKP